MGMSNCRDILVQFVAGTCLRQDAMTNPHELAVSPNIGPRSEPTAHRLCDRYWLARLQQRRTVCTSSSWYPTGRVHTGHWPVTMARLSFEPAPPVRRVLSLREPRRRQPDHLEQALPRRPLARSATHFFTVFVATPAAGFLPKVRPPFSVAISRRSKRPPDQVRHSRLGNTHLEFDRSTGAQATAGRAPLGVNKAPAASSNHSSIVRPQIIKEA